MTFDSQSIKRLNDLKGQLAKEGKKQKENLLNAPSHKGNLHEVEIQTNPEKLFHSLMEISPDGSVPPHLIERLRQTESDTVLNEKINFRKSSSEESNSLSPKKQTSVDSLYLSFQNLLLEDEI